MLNYKSRKVILATILAVVVFQFAGLFLFAPKTAKALEGPGFYAKWVWERVKDAYGLAKEAYNSTAFNSAMMSFTTRFGTNLAKNLISGNNGGKPMQFTESLKSSSASAAQDAAAEFISTLAYGKKGSCIDMPTKYRNKACYTDNDCVVKVTPAEAQKAQCLKDSRLANLTVSIDPNTGGFLFSSLNAENNSISIPDSCTEAFVGPLDDTGTIPYRGGSCSGGAASLNQWAGFNLCAPSVNTQQIQFSLYWLKAQNPPPPACTWSTITKNWSTFWSQATSEEVLRAYSISFNLEEMPISNLAAMGVLMNETAQGAADEFTSLMDSTADFKPLLGLINKKKILTPATSRSQQEMLDKIGQVQLEAQSNAAANKATSWMSNFANAFVISWMSEMTQKIKDTLAGKNNPSTHLSDDGTIANGITAREVDEIFSQLLTVRVKSGAEVDTVESFSSCPGDTTYAASNNCVIDQNLAQAIRDRLTIKEALAKGSLHGDWYVATPAASDGPSDYLSRYSLTNIKKMRNARVMPLGLEIAASMIANRDASIPVGVDKFTLAEIVSGYNTPTSPWYHLVDPDWILDAPDARCYAQTYGSIPQANSSNRQENCTALQFCLAEDDKGSCKNWGFCTKEKVNAEFSGKTCPSYYASCRAYTRATDKSSFSYLKDSLVTGNCGENNYGCQQYYTTASRPASETATVNPLVWNTGGPSIFLNHNVKKCSASNDGCSQFLRLRDSDGYLLSASAVSGASPLQTAINSAIASEAGTSDYYYDNYKVEELYLKKAPAYMNCYDADPANDDPDCKNYAAQCSLAEVGCNRYTPSSGDPWIPAVTSPSDFCPSECNGYQSFYAVPLWWDNTGSHWSDGLTNFIPSTATKCSAQAVGCEQYTNLDTVAAGGEGLEYYSQTRVCQKTSNPSCSTFYTWEGDDRVGYQLRSYNLIKNSLGSPCTQLSGTDGGNATSRACDASSAGSLSCHRGTCSSTGASCNLDSECITAESPTATCIADANSDCYQFYDSSGRSYFASKIQTISCNDDCHAYRKNNLNGCVGGSGSDCQMTLIASESRSCAAKDAGCREYRGNTAGNVRNIFSDNFNAGTLGSWHKISDIDGSHDGHEPAISATSLYVGGNSLNVLYNNELGASVSAVVERDLESGKISNNKSYTLSFLAKSEQTNLSGTTNLNQLRVQFKGHDATSEAFTINQPITTEWQIYTVGPVYTEDWGSTVTALQFINNTAVTSKSNFYLDNVVLKEIPSSQFVVKNSWNTPTSCDTNFGNLSDPSDDTASLGFMAGCSSYTNGDGVLVYLKSFTSLCSSDKAGCKAVIDTQNSSFVGTKTYNTSGYCDDASLAACAGVGGVGESAGCSSGVSCLAGSPDDDITVPSDQISFFVDDPAKRCQSSQRGCSAFGVSSTEATYLINDPDLYTDDPESTVSTKILCSFNQLGCQKFTTTDGGSAYFVDPQNRTCEYKKIVTDGIETSGWFKTGTSNPCPTFSSPSGISIPNFSDTDSGAALCASANNLCTAFKDPLSGNQITYIKNNDFTNNDCDGMVSKKNGCLLYSDLSQINDSGTISNNWSASLTYSSSASANGEPVSPLSGTDAAPSDSNIILQQKINGRGCAEWLDCRSWEYQWDQNSSQYKKVCTLLGRCDKLASDNNSCSADGWVDGSKTDSSCASDSDCSRATTGLACVSGTCTPENMLRSAYASRDITMNYFGSEYSGYSLFGVYPLDLLQEKKFGDNYYLTRSVSASPASDYGLTGKTCTPATAASDCQTATTGYICQNSHCVADKSCRGYPEADSPFSQNTTYANANKCETAGNGAIGDGCQCSYKKVQYSGENKYYNYNQDAPAGICTAGTSDKINQACNQPSDCCGNGYDSEKSSCANTGESPTCSYKTREDLLYGWPGVCLELDPSKPGTGACLTWYPADRLPSDRDIYNTHTDAGYFATAGKQWYCQGNSVQYVQNLFKSDTSTALGKKIIPINSDIKIYRQEIEKISLQIVMSTDSSESPAGADPTGKISGVYNFNTFQPLAGSFNFDDSESRKNITLKEGYSHEIEHKKENGWYACLRNGSGGKIIDGCFSEGSDKISKIEALFEGDVLIGFQYTGPLGSHDGPVLAQNSSDPSHYYGIIIFFKPACQNVIGINSATDSLSAVSYSNRLWESGIYYQNNGGSTPCAPFGAIGADAFTNFTLISSAATKCQAGSTAKTYSSSEVLQSLFAKVYQVKELRSENRGYENSYDGLWDIRSSASSVLAPQIQAIINGSPAVSNKFAVNNSLTDITATTGLATINFYAWADADHMPVRGVQVDWDDGTSYSGSNDILARNYKPQCKKLCAQLDKNSNIISQSGVSCSSDSDCASAGVANKCFPATFGDTAEACENHYWQFNHIYQCNPSSSSYSSATNSCTFKPKVRVKDNWSWYTNGYYGGDAENPTGGWIDFSGNVAVPASF